MATGDIVLAGGTGFLGQALAEHLRSAGRRVVVLSRRAGGETEGVKQVRWDAGNVGDWARELDGAAAVVNLAGRSVNCRYSARNRAEILNSRVNATRAIGAAVARCARPPAVWLNASSATIYRDARDRAMDEAAGDPGEGFSVEVCQAWERAFFEAPAPRTRKVAMRLSIVFGPAPGGVFGIFQRIVRLGLGGRQGDGGQFVSWLHVTDFCRAVEWLLAHDEISGPVNLCAPVPLPNAEFMRAWREACGVKVGLPATAWMLRIGAFFLRTETELLLKSRRVVPRRLQDSGFHFQFGAWRPAVADLTATAERHGLPEIKSGR
ncbi:MAG TPA: TIGR01777 family oxidoreductase [Opitutus sp.]|nr:TIGR01777 family oxidoreductase [Opitutus sp.]